MRKLLIAVVLVVTALVFGSTAHAAQPVLQRGYDAGVSGANLAEVTLNTSNVTPSTFGLVFKLPVDDNVYAQPLYVPSVAIPGQGTHNVVYVATMSDSLYAFDADTGVKLWSVNFASSVGASPVAYAQFAFAGNRNIVGNLGILSTPVIDPATHILYLVACTLENNALVYRLHAVNITNGTEPYSNMVISGTYPGIPTFDAPHQTQREALALSGNQIVIGFGAMELESSNVGGYVGWVMAYNKTNLVQSGAFATVSTGTHGGGVWQSGRPPVIDSSGYVYVYTGNGYTAGYDGVNNFSESALKLNPASGLSLVDWFTPSNWSAMDAGDLDLSSSGPMLIPGTSLLAGGGKTGIFYLLNTANLGKETATNGGAVQHFTIAADEMRGGPVYWQRSTANGGPLLYDWGDSDWLKAFAFNGSTFTTSPSAEGGNGTQNWPGGILALSANADTPGSGVLWATVAVSGDAENNPPTPGALYAFDANNIANELWNSTMNPARDNFGNFAKFVPPLVANGKVYVATQSSQVAVYGLLTATIGIKFVGQGTAMGSTEVAGVVAQSNWNDAPGMSSTAPLVLVNQTGASSGATVTWSTNGIFNLPIADTAGNYRMMRGYLDTVGGTTTVTVAGLPANAGGYHVYVYADGDNGGSRTGAYQISGTGITTTSVNLTDPAYTNFSGTFTQANNSTGNYVMFTTTAAATGFTITATPGASTDAYPRAPLNAIQIVPN
jgi:hypothetical protein